MGYRNYLTGHSMTLQFLVILDFLFLPLVSMSTQLKQTHKKQKTQKTKTRKLTQTLRVPSKPNFKVKVRHKPPFSKTLE